MSLSKEMKRTVRSVWQYAYRPPAVYAIGNNVVFTIQNGPVHLRYFLGRAVSGAPAAGSTVTTTIAGVAGDAGAVNCNGAVNSIIMIPLNVASAVTPNALAHPVLTAAVASDGMLASVGNVIVVVAGANFVVTIEWILVWRPLTPTARVYAP